MIRTYSELSSIKTFDERFEYLKLGGFVGEETFGFNRYINQKFYQSYEWKRVRREVIIRDNGCDLGVDSYEINKGIIIHHMNPITKDDIANITEYLLNPEYLITTMLMTHNAIHYGDVSLIQSIPIERAKNDTCPWKR